MSDTPRTDAAKIACGFQAVPDSFLEHARQLERENAAQRSTSRGKYAMMNEKLKAENAVLREDKERLDWCDNRGILALPYAGMNMRQSIDAARKEQS